MGCLGRQQVNSTNSADLLYSGPMTNGPFFAPEWLREVKSNPLNLFDSVGRRLHGNAIPMFCLGTFKIRPVIQQGNESRSMFRERRFHVGDHLSALMTPHRRSCPRYSGQFTFPTP